MSDQFLASPSADSPVLGRFCAHFGLDTSAKSATDEPLSLETLTTLARSFSTIPYENLSKIIKLARCPDVERARRSPVEVIREHLAYGTGGTCFSLTATFLHIVRALGLKAEPILADRHYGIDTHCALLVWLDGRPHLVDPGYLIVRPVPLGAGETRVPTSFNDVLLVPQSGDAKLALYTENNGSRTQRLTFKLDPVDGGEFLRAWDASFGWDMMTYPVLTRANAAGQLYLQDGRLQTRDRDSVVREQIDIQELPQKVEQLFGLDPRVTRKALEVLRSRGERD